MPVRSASFKQSIQTFFDITQPPVLLSSSLYSNNFQFTMASAAAESKVGDNIALSIKDLDFSYSGAAAPCLKKINLELPKGSRCLLVGDNGAGKNK